MKYGPRRCHSLSLTGSMDLGSQVKNTMQASAALSLMLAALGALWSASAAAYIGPGAGVTLFGALWAVLAAIFVAIGAILMWPVRILLRRRRKRSAEASAAVEKKSS